jgi:hypothetical protein
VSTLDEMRKEASRLLALENPGPQDYAYIHALLDRRAREIRAPFERKIARIKRGYGREV